MICEKCRLREAVVQVTEHRNGTQTHHMYCLSCAKDLDIGLNNIFTGDTSIGRFLSSLLAETVSKSEKGYKLVTCPSCKTSYEEFVKDSRFGCKDCYEVFGILIEDNIKQLQGTSEHKGKHPKIRKASEAKTVSKPDLEQFNQADHSDQTEAAEGMEEESITDIQTLRELLHAAISVEDYEKAAKLRDKIKELSK